MTERLADHTTLGVGGPAREFIRCTTEADLVDLVRARDAAGTPVLVLGGGSNVLVADDGFDGTVVQVAVRGISDIVERERVVVTAGAGEPWDDLVAFTVSRGWAGLEALSFIPGSVGATPVQNVGAYGQEVASTIVNVRVFDRRQGMVRDLTPAECAFAYRSSVFKHEPGRWVVLAVSFALAVDPWSIVRYGQLAAALETEVGAAVTATSVRDAVGTLRRSKGMVLDADDPDTRSAGSFFTNPIVEASVAAALPADCPRYAAVDGVKLSAAWLIEQAGVTRGWQVRPTSGARVSTKHTLALTNADGATTAEILELARAIRARVQDAFGITLQPEPVLVGCTL